MMLRLCAAICGGAILCFNSSAAMAKLGTVNVHSVLGGKTSSDEHAYFGTSTAARRRNGCTKNQGKTLCNVTRTSLVVTIVGAASMYDPFQPGYEEGGLETASGELFDPMAWTAAIHTDLREAFGGIHYGKDYRPAFALVEVADKRAIIKINDVGPLKPGRVIDFNQQTMHYFDPSLQLGIVHGVKITPLPGDGWAAGPISG